MTTASHRLHLLGVLVLAAVLLAGSAASEPTDPGPTDPEPSILFTEEARELGLDFVYDNGMSGELYFPEIVGGGVALFDYDNDGDLDVYLVQGGPLGARDAGAGPSDRLFRNDLAFEGGKQRPRFVDVTAVSGLDQPGSRAAGYGMGVATGDYDNDGNVDLYVTNFGSNQLWRNQGDGSFRDATAEAGVDDPRWSVPAVFFDYDGDGWLDLWVGNYTDYSLPTHVDCFADSGVHDYCKPLVYKAVPDRLLRNRGRGADGRVTFEDVTIRAGLGEAYGRALGVVTADFNGDRRLDFYVANDYSENQLWIQQPGADGTVGFVEEALFAGCAVNREGQPEGSMGVDAQDFDGDGDEDLFMTHVVGETNTLYLNNGNGVFRDVTFERGLAAPSFALTGFGTAWFDVENDGQLDLLIVNGAVEAIESQARARDPFPYRQPNQLFRGRADGVYEEVSALAGEAFSLSETSRGAAFGDLDNDGDVDVVLTNTQAPVHLLINRTRPLGHWLGVRLLGRRDQGRRDQLGARFTVQPLDRWWRIRTEGSYASSHDPRRLVGLGARQDGAREDTSELLIEWPGGRLSRWRGLPVDTWVNVQRPAVAKIADRAP